MRIAMTADPALADAGGDIVITDRHVGALTLGVSARSRQRAS
jgi:hypothetical protein